MKAASVTGFDAPSREGLAAAVVTVAPTAANTLASGSSFDLLRVTSAIKKGDEGAFGLFYERYYDRLFRFMIVLTQGDEELSRELLQTVMTKVVRAMKAFAEEKQFWAWLTAIARNAFIDAMRKASRAPKVIPFSGTMLEEAGISDDPEGPSPLLKALENALEILDQDERQLLDAFYAHHGSQQEIATQLATTPKAIESKLARVRQKLRQHILDRLHHEDF